MTATIEFPVLLRLTDERSAAIRAAVAAAPGLDVRVPTCPEWTLFDLVRHQGEGRRSWAATVAAGPAAPAKSAPKGAPAAPRELEAVSAWLAASTQRLLDALREAGPDRGCWTWWGASQSPRACGAVARHQLHQIAAHTYDAQVTTGARSRCRTSCGTASDLVLFVYDRIPVDSPRIDGVAGPLDLLRAWEPE
ncbi:maleylpyruvate isomerase N-terminal domain-containing protein [Streptomyces sp. NPDC002769]|uniref:maleylpyruvate isomerase N-terminal domain-containing protein n=1 Tax=Streptomyces sp. NPDC002769 TaxID=3154542 RepID=UPI00333224AB